ncbi:vacuolar protein sorting-associated protein VTA1 homolog [Microplitis mediator]|uniref:vacuolar protein sorting-associated protein VTA1 homolog n=1 Tax=Microplitis mediator TaxID=375433 RepID=UPI002553FBC0|nr:vacuolar protein sorting-associated protein VTA1 homolog [Microplitis mediator]
MSNINLPEIPASMKNIQHYLKIASEHDRRDPIISYWARFYAAQTAINQSNKRPDETNFLIKLMTWLENTKKELHDNDSITNDVAAQAYLENYALKIFTYADKLDRASNFSKNLVLSFYTAGFLYDILTTFGELSEESSQNRKYAKWKAAYIHNCLKNGETPIPGPIDQKEGNDSTNYKPESDNEATSNNNNFDLPSVSNDQSPNTNPADSGSGNIPLDHNSQSSDDTSIAASSIKSSGGRQNVSLNADQILKAQKYIKWAGSAINYDDISTAVENLQKALCLLTTGKDG